MALILFCLYCLFFLFILFHIFNEYFGTLTMDESIFIFLHIFPFDLILSIICFLAICILYILEAVKKLEYNTYIFTWVCIPTHAYAFMQQNTPKADLEMQTIYVAYSSLLPTWSKCSGHLIASASVPWHTYVFAQCFCNVLLSLFIWIYPSVPIFSMKVTQIFQAPISSPLKSHI